MTPAGYLSLGSNVGDRRGHLQAAVAGLAEREVTVLASSSVYDSEPVGDVLDQDTFLNACLRVATALDPLALLDACQAVERARGRVQAGEADYVRHGPRPLDVDILLLGDLTTSGGRLTVPHAELARRRFVLVPLLELDPELAIPGAGRAADALAALGEEQAVRRAGPPLAV